MAIHIIIFRWGGGTLTGTLYTASSIYDTISGGHSGIGALHLNNSDITGVNAISTADLSDSWQESLAFKRSNGNWDTFRAADGTFYFGINNGTEYTAIHSGNYTSYVNTTNFPGLNKTGTVTSVAVSNGGGLSISGSPITGSGTITISHSNSVTAQTTQALYPIKIDANGHISAYGSAVTSLPASDVYSWAKASTKPSYTLDEVSDGSTRKLANYLPLAGGTMTGAAPINFTANTVQMNFRTGHDSYNAKLEYMTSGNEALVFATQAAVTSYMFVNGLNLTNRSDYGAITSNPITMQLKSNKVSINRTIRGDSDSQTETLYVGGDTRVAGNNFYVGSASGSQCHQQYDATNECLKFLFD